MMRTRGRSFRLRAARRWRRFGFALLLTLAAHHSAPVVAAEPPASTAPTAPPVAPPPHPTTDLYGDRLPAGAIARFGSIRLRHLGLADFFIRPDGTSARTVGRDGFLRTWDLATGRQTEAHALAGEFGKSSGSGRLLFSPDRKLLAAIFPKRIVVWDADTGHEVQCLERRNLVMDRAVFSPDGRTLAVLENQADSEIPSVILLDRKTGQERRLDVRAVFGPAGLRLCHPRFSPDGRYLIVAHESRRTPVCVFEVGGSGAGEMYKLDNKRDFARLAASPDGKWLVACRGDALVDVRLLDLATGKERSSITLGGVSAGGVRAVAFSPDGNTLALSETDDDKKVTVQLRDPTTLKERARYELDEHPTDLLFSPNGKVIAGLHSSGLVFIDTVAGRVIRCPDANVLRAAFSPDGRTLVATGDDQRLRVWDVASGRERHESPAELVRDRSAGSAGECVTAPDGRSVAVNDRVRGDIFVWSLSDGRLIRHLTPTGEQWWGYRLAFSPDGQTLSATDHLGRLRDLDALTGAERRVVQLEFPDPPRSVAGIVPERAETGVWVSPDLRRAVTILHAGTETHLLLRDLSGVVPERQVSFVGQVCAWAWPNVAVWVPKERGLGLSVVSAVTGRTRLRVPGHVPRGGPVAFSADGRLLANRAEGDLQVDVRETATGRAVAVVNTGRVECLALAPDGRRLVTAGANGLRVWDLATGAECKARSSRPRAADEITLACAWVVLTPDGQSAITEVADGTGLVWDLRAFPVEPLAPATGAARAACWAELLPIDAGVAHAATWRLAETPDAAVRFLAARLKPIEGPDPVAVLRLIADLCDEDFPTREAAQKQLAALGPLVGAELIRAINGHESPEVRRRARELFDKMPLPMPTGESLRSVRAIAVLERIGTAEARAVLTALAGGAAGASETEEAKAALVRLGAVKP